MDKSRIGFSHFSKHALERLNRRTLFKSEELIALLNNDSFVSLGVETGFNREHCLVYCEFDNSYYVAVQDKKFGTVVTILPLAYHQTLSWRMSTKAKKIDSNLLKKAKTAAIDRINSKDKPLTLRLKIRFVNENGKLQTATVIKLKAIDYSYNPSLLIDDPIKVTNLVSRWVERHPLLEIVDLFSEMGRQSSIYFCDDEVIARLNEQHNLKQPSTSSRLLIN